MAERTPMEETEEHQRTPTDAEGIAPPSGHEITLLQAWLNVTEQYQRNLTAMQSPWAEYLGDFAALLHDVLHPED